MADGYLELAGTGWGQQDISSDGSPVWRSGGSRIDWDTVAAVAGAPVVLEGDARIDVGEKFLRYGQVMVEDPVTGMVGPFDPAVPARATLTAENFAGLVRRTIVYRPNEARRGKDTLVGLIIGGKVHRNMVRATDGAPSLAAGPTFAALRTAADAGLVFDRNFRASHTTR